MTRRDRVALAALGIGAALAVLSLRFVGPWAALVLAVAAIGVACGAYRIRPSRIDVDHPEGWAPGPSEARSGRRTDSR